MALQPRHCSFCTEHARNDGRRWLRLLYPLRLLLLVYVRVRLVPRPRDQGMFSTD